MSEKSLSLDQKVLTFGAGVFAGLGTLWLMNDIPDAIYGNNPYETVKDAIFNIGIPTISYITAAASLYLTKIFD